MFFPVFFKVRLCFLAIVFEHLEKICFVGKVFFFKLTWIGRLPAAASRCFSQFRIHDVMWERRPLAATRVAASGCKLF